MQLSTSTNIFLNSIDGNITFKTQKGFSKLPDYLKGDLAKVELETGNYCLFLASKGGYNEN